MQHWTRLFDATKIPCPKLGSDIHCCPNSKQLPIYAFSPLFKHLHSHQFLFCFLADTQFPLFLKLTICIVMLFFHIFLATF